jgi:hypothetical protein
MARSFHVHELRPRVRNVRSIRQGGAILLFLLLFALLAALWVFVEPVNSLLPVPPPA